jgi:hypothetical protein
MPIQAPSVAAKVGGYILRNDGMVRAAAQVQQQRVTAYNGGAGATDLASTAVLQDVASVCTMLMPTSTGAQLPAPPAPYPSMPQQVIFFPATALP